MTRIRWLVPLVSLVLIAVQAGHASQPLPRVKVANDRRTFATEAGQPFVPFGVTYYRPGTGWAPQVWKQFDPEATKRDFARMKELGVNCVRVFLSYGSFYTDPGVLRPEGLAKFDQFLALAEEAGIYVHPTGPDHWEGPPNWQPVAVADPRTLQYTVQFWELFAARYRGRHVIFAYDLRNEPMIDWQSDVMTPQWNAWLQKRYGSGEKLAAAWGVTNHFELGKVSVPPAKSALRSRQLLDFQLFREELADEWTRRQVAAIKAADPEALVTVGCLQTSVPVAALGRGSRLHGLPARAAGEALGLPGNPFLPPGERCLRVQERGGRAGQPRLPGGHGSRSGARWKAGRAG